MKVLKILCGIINYLLKSKNKSEKKMLTTFDEIIEVTLHHEGGYVHDPKDLGGETNFGMRENDSILMWISRTLQKRRCKGNLQERLLG